MRTKEEIMEDACYKENFDTLEEKHGYLLIEIACDRRDEQIAHNNRMECKTQETRYAPREKRGK